MLAALSIADHDLFERMIELIFADAGGNNTSRQAEAMSQMIKEKTVSTVQACKEMLMQEPPERLSDFYGTVSCHPSLFFRIFGPTSRYVQTTDM